MEVAATRHWDPQAAGHRRLAAAVAAQRPDAVYLGGTLDTGGARVIVALRRALGPDVDLLVPDGFTPTPLLAKQAGGAARGVFLAVTGLTPESLPAEGRRFVRAFATTLPGVEIEPTAVYGAAAADVVLDAIARSDGSRASVLGRAPGHAGGDAGRPGRLRRRRRSAGRRGHRAADRARPADRRVRGRGPRAPRARGLATFMFVDRG